jgi:hypothetical protein
MTNNRRPLTLATRDRYVWLLHFNQNLSGVVDLSYRVLRDDIMVVTCDGRLSCQKALADYYTPAYAVPPASLFMYA